MKVILFIGYWPNELYVYFGLYRLGNYKNGKSDVDGYKLERPILPPYYRL